MFYNELISYYNTLFNASENDSSWCYFNFKARNNEPAELYLWKIDSTSVEIEANVLTYR